MIRVLFCLVMMVFVSGCGQDSTDPSADAASDVPVLAETDVGDDAINTEGVFTLSLDVKFPAGSVMAGYRPVAAVYKASDYRDFTVRPDKMPTTALLGNDQADELVGPITDFGQTVTYEFPYGDYSIVVGIAETNGLPKPVTGKMFIARAIRTDTRDTHIVITANDPDWSPY